MSGVASKDGASISQERRSAVETACRTWINRLIDPSRRNNLLYFRHLQEGTLDLSASPSDAIAVLIGPACASVKLADLVLIADTIRRPAFRTPPTMVSSSGLAQLSLSGGLRQPRSTGGCCDWISPRSTMRLFASCGFCTRTSSDD